MTVRVNLLPREQRGLRGSFRAHKGKLVGAAVMTMGIFYGGVLVSAVRWERYGAVAQAELNTMEPLLAKANALQAQETVIQQEESYLLAVRGRSWADVLLSLRDATPARVTWTSLDLEGDTALLKGSSPELGPISELLGGLLGNTAVAGVTLRYAAESESGEPISPEQPLAFELHIQLASSGWKGAAEP